MRGGPSGWHLRLHFKVARFMYMFSDTPHRGGKVTGFFPFRERKWQSFWSEERNASQQ